MREEFWDNQKCEGSTQGIKKPHQEGQFKTGLTPRSQGDSSVRQGGMIIITWIILLSNKKPPTFQKGVLNSTRQTKTKHEYRQQQLPEFNYTELTLFGK